MAYHPFIEKVLASQTFANKEVLKGLLKYLYEESKNGRVLKEADIAIGYFKRGADFVPGEDTIVRVTVYKLRALLEKYYSEEGRADTNSIEIPKGSYGILIRNGQKPAKKRPVLILILGVLLLVSLALNGVLFLLPDKETNVSNPVWSSYIKAGQPVFITLGDPFFYRIKAPKKGSLIVRDITINSKEDLDLLKPQNLQEERSEVSELNYPYFSRNNLWPLPDLISFFAHASVETRLQTLSESNINDIKNNNVVFIANINSFRWMNKFLEKSSLRIFTNPRQIRIMNGVDSLVLSVPENVKGSYADYALLVKIPGPNNNQITLMGDFHASALKGLSNFISKKPLLSELEKQIKKRYGYFPEYFEMVVKVTSYNYSDFNTELIHFKEIK